MIRMERSELQHFSSYRHGAQLCQPNLTILVLASNPREPAIDLVHSSRLLWQVSFYCNILSVCMYCQWRLSKAAQHAVYLSPAPSPHPNRSNRVCPFAGHQGWEAWVVKRAIVDFQGAAAEYHPDLQAALQVLQSRVEPEGAVVFGGLVLGFAIRPRLPAPAALLQQEAFRPGAGDPTMPCCLYSNMDLSCRISKQNMVPSSLTSRKHSLDLMTWLSSESYALIFFPDGHADQKWSVDSRLYICLWPSL